MKIQINRLFAPEVYLIMLCCVYAISFIETPLNWGKNILVDARYIYIFLTFIVSFTSGQFLINKLQHQNYPNRKIGEIQLDTFVQKNLLAVYCFSLLCIGAILLKSGGFAMIAENRTLFRRDAIAALGGYVAYPAFLITPLSAVALYLFIKNKRFLWLLLFIISVTLQLLQLNRQELLMCIVTPIMIIFFFKTISVMKIVWLTLGFFFFLYLIGSLVVLRIGDPYLISSTIPLIELPFWIVVGDFSLAMKLSHLVTDIIGPAGMEGRYVFGSFASIFIPGYTAHGADVIRVMFTKSETAQSLAAPLSYYVDGGLILVFALGFFQGILAQALWKLARQNEHLFFRFAYVINFLSLLWTIRAGTVSFIPAYLYQIAALSFVLRPGIYAKSLTGPFLISLSGLFILTIPISLIFMIIRIW
ncbi:MAG: oligosaccharide repeat unit polymerase [Desulfamplus sp.]|nr:oligosaccharide repeat unit polymerase [Desulfamplus sp.]